MTATRRSPTMDDVAARAGVSRALVSLVMRGSAKVSDHRRLAVTDAARELGYRPNAVARSLAERRSNTFGVVINDPHIPFLAELVDGIHDEANRHGFRLLLNAAWPAGADEEQAIEVFLEHRVDAVIVLGPQVSQPVLAEAAASVPLVVVGAEAPGIDAVVNDDQRGGELVVEHLVGLGHTAVVHIDGGLGAGAANRRKGFVSAMETRGLEPDVLDGEATGASGLRAVELLLTRQALPSALFCANDLAAVAAIDRLEDAGLTVPGDISVAGYDNTPVAGCRRIGLTTVNQPRHEMGRAAVRCAVERLDGGRRAAATRVLPPELIVRTSTGPPPT